MTVIFVFVVKTFFTGVFLAWGFANGARLNEWSTNLCQRAQLTQQWEELKAKFLAFYSTWPGARNYLAMAFANQIEA